MCVCLFVEDVGLLDWAAMLLEKLLQILICYFRPQVGNLSIGVVNFKMYLMLPLEKYKTCMTIKNTHTHTLTHTNTNTHTHTDPNSI